MTRFLNYCVDPQLYTIAMTEKQKPDDQDTPKPELVDEITEELDIDSIIPKMDNPEQMVEEKPCIIGDEQITDLYNEILENARNDREQCDELLMNFVDMVMNDGDSSSASKEAVVNLMKVKSDLNDKMSKIADLQTRIKLKERDTFPRYLAAQQNNKVIIEGSKRDFLKMIHKKAKDAKKNDK